MENTYLFEEKKSSTLILKLFDKIINRFRKNNGIKTDFMKQKHTWLLLSLALILNNTFAQSCANYSVARTTGITYNSIYSTGNVIPGWRNASSPGSPGGAYDDSRSYPVSIGFDFWYLGVRYTQFSVSTNGFIDFSSSIADGTGTGAYGYDNSKFSSTSPTGLALAPFYEDMTTTAAVDPLGEDIKYQLSGTAPNRVLTVEWREMSRYAESTPSNLNFQINLYESTGIIEFVYGTNTFGTASWTYSCGINNSTISSTPSATQLKCQQTANTATFNNTVKNNLSTVPTSNSKLTLTPATPSGNPSGLSFSSVTKIAMTLNWTDNATNEAGYVIYNSTDNVNFNFASQTSANATSTVISGLLPETTFYWQVFAVTDGKLSTALTGSNATLPAGNIISNGSGLWNSGSTWVGGGVPTAGDNVTIANGHTVTLDVNGNCNSLTVGQGSSGQLIVGNSSTSRSFTVNNNITVNAGATLNTGSTPATHTLSIEGNITNNGTLDLAPTGTRICNVTFNKVGNQTVSGSGTTTNFNLITLNMGNSYNNVLDIASTNFTAPSNFLTITYGTFKLSSAVTITPFTSNETISGTCGLWVNNDGATINTTGGNITLSGYVKVSAGTLNIGNASNNCLTSNGGGNLIITGGNVNIAGRFDRVDITTTNSLNMSGGILTVNKTGSTTSGYYPFMMDVLGSSFTMSGGTIVIERPGSSNFGFNNTGATCGSITGGTIQIGNSSTPASQTILINASHNIPSLVIGNSVAVIAQLSTNSVTINNDLTVSSGSTFDLTTLTANRNTAGGTLTIAGTLILKGTTGGQSGSNFPSNFSTLSMSDGTVNFNKTSGGQTVYSTPSYNNLILSNTSGTQTSDGALTIVGTLSTTSGGTLDMGTYALNTATVSNSGTIRTQNSSSTPLTNGLTWAGTVIYTSTIGGQTVTGGNFNNLTFLNSSGTNIVSGNVSVSGTLTTTAGGSLDMVTNTLSGAISTLTNNGTIFTQNISSTPIPTGKTWGGTINYNATEGGQTIMAGTYNKLTIGNNDGIQTAAGSITVNNTLITTAGGTLNLVTNTLNGTLTTLTNNGIIRTQNTGTAIPTGKSWGGTVQYDGVAQTVSTGTYLNLTLGGSGAKAVTTASTNVNNIFSMEGTATVSNYPTYGASATLQYNKPAAFTAGSEWKSNFSSSGGIVVMNSGEISMNSNETVNAPVVVNNGSTLNLSTYIISGTGTFTVDAGGEIKIGHAAGIATSGATGNIQVSGARTFPTTATYTYIGGSSQVIGNGLPTTVENVTINNGSPSMVLNGSQIINGTLRIISGKISIGANSLTLNGDFIGNASNCITGGSTSNLTIGGSGTIGTIYFDQSTPGTTNLIQNLTINRNSQTVTLGNAVNVTGTLTPTAGTLASGGFLTLVSNVSSTARVSEIASGADITGDVISQCYIPAEVRRYRMLSPATSNFTYAQLKDNIFFTGPGGVTNGFDYATANSYTGYTFQEGTSGSGRGWKGVSNITNTASAGTGLYIFVRGDRTLASPAWYTAPYVAQNTVTIDYSGPLNKGDISPALTYTNTGVPTDDGWNLVGNPYASQIDWTLLTKSNLSSFYYIYDPATGSYISDNGTNPIASGQAFFVQATAASPTITFTESAKTGSTSSRYFKTMNPKLTMKMIKDSVNSDVAFLEFVTGSSVNYDINEDALKMYNSLINFGITVNADTIDLQYNSTSPLGVTSDTFKLFASAASGTYHLNFEGLNSIKTNKQILLIDNFTSTVTNLRLSPDYTFTITSNPSSNGLGRFYIVFSPSASLPVKLISFSATKSSNQSDVNLNWSTASEQSSDKFIVQRSFTNDDFADIGVLNAAGNSKQVLGYSFTDKNILSEVNTGNIYYRLKQSDKNGSFIYSYVVSISIEKQTQNNISIFPNPATNFITVNSLQPNSLIEIFDLTGKLMKKFSSIENNPTVDVSNFKAGIYLMRINSSNDQSPLTFKFTKE